MIARRSVLGASLAAPFVATARAAAPARVVCVGSALTECVFALGEGDRLIAVDSSSRFPARAATLPQIGYMRSLPTEGIASLAPDLLLLSDEAGPPDAVAVLRATGLPMRIVHDGAGPGAAETKVRAVGDALGRGAEAAAMADAIAADWATLDAPLAAVRRRPKAIFVLSVQRGAPLVSGEDTHADAALRAAGAENAVRAWRGYRPLSAEAAASLAPDVVVMMDFSVGEAGGADAVFGAPALAVTPAARTRRLVAMDPRTLNFGPRAAWSRHALARSLHPGLALPAPPERPWTAG